MTPDILANAIHDLALGGARLPDALRVDIDGETGEVRWANPAWAGRALGQWAHALRGLTPDALDAAVAAWAGRGSGYVSAAKLRELARAETAGATHREGCRLDICDGHGTTSILVPASPPEWARVKRGRRIEPMTVACDCGLCPSGLRGRLPGLRKTLTTWLRADVQSLHLDLADGRPHRLAAYNDQIYTARRLGLDTPDEVEVGHWTPDRRPEYAAAARAIVRRGS